jgi:hypothetical protein
MEIRQNGKTYKIIIGTSLLLGLDIEVWGRWIGFGALF